MSSSACLALLLDGPLQSWGVSSRFTRRTTAVHPTKSGVVGMLAAALGIDKHGEDEVRQIKRLAALLCTTITLPKHRAGREIPMLRLNDYQTIGGGYSATDWMKKPRAASGALLQTLLSERHYLLDARFGVLLEGDKTYLEELAHKLQNPTWGLWLGRKCCIPSSPILVGLSADPTAAWAILAKAARLDESRPLEHYHHVVEGDAAEAPDAQWLNDSPRAFGAPRGEHHTPRRIRHIRRI